MTDLRQVGPEVFFVQGDIANITQADVEFLKERALESPRRRARLCIHRALEEPLHDMVIVLARGAYVRPHKHLAKTESFQIVQGEMAVFLLDEEGRPEARIDMAERSTGKPFLHRLSLNKFHCMVPLADFVAFHEATTGPFRDDESIWADWAPAETADPRLRQAYVSCLLAAPIKLPLGTPRAIPALQLWRACLAPLLRAGDRR
ncbi:MAG TPA: WbuC family cupin fold metalloprotein [Chloroflexota bacterium]|nr:WbuC family cupin fold metalloprotein [Chloroflexota bacterium]